MIEQMRIDTKRYLRSRFAFFSFFLLALLFLASLFSSWGKSDTQQLALLGAVQETVAEIQTRIDELPKNAKTSERKREQERLAYLEPLLAEYSTAAGNEQKRNQLNLAYATFNLQEFAEGRGEDVLLIPYPDKEQKVTQTALKQQVSYYQYLVDHKLSDVPDSSSQPAINYLSNQLMYRISSVLLFVFLAIQATHFFTLDKQQGSIRFLNVLPISKHKLLMSKVWTFFLLNAGLFMAATVVVLAVVTGFNGFGHLKDPLVQVMVGRTGVATLGQFLLAYTGLFLAGTFLLSIASAFVSLFTRHFISHFMWLLLPLAVTQFGWLNAELLQKWYYYLPFHYLDISGMLFGGPSQFMYPVGLGIVILIDWSLVFYAAILVTFGFRKRL